MTDMNPRNVTVANSNQRSNKLHVNNQHAGILHHFSRGVVFLLPLASNRKVYGGREEWEKHFRKVEIIIMPQLKVRCYYLKILVWKFTQ